MSRQLIPRNMGLTFAPDATYDVGNNNADRPRNVYVQSEVRIGDFGSDTYLNFETVSGANDLYLHGRTGLYLRANNATRWNVSSAGHFLAYADATYDIGQSGANRPRDLFISRNAVFGGTVTTGTLGPQSGTLYLRANASIRWQIDSSTGAFLASSDGGVDIGAAASGRPRNLFLTSYAQQTEIAKPATPAAGTVRLYPKSDHHMYALDSTGAEWDLSFGQAAADTRYLALTGGTMSGSILFSSEAYNLGSTSARAKGVYANILDVNGSVNFGGTLFVQNNAEFANRATFDYDIVTPIVGAPTTSSLVLATSNTDRWKIDGANGHFLAAADGAYDIGTSAGNRPRDLYLQHALITPAFWSPSGQDLVFGAASFIRWRITQDGHFGSDWDGHYNIGTATNFRPEHMYLTGTIFLGKTTPQPKMLAPGTTNALSLEAPASYTFLSSRSGTHLGANAYWNGTDWFRYDTSAKAAAWIVNENGLVFYTAPSGTGSIPWASKWTVDTNGVLTLNYAGGGAGSPTIQIPNGAFLNGKTAAGATQPMLAVTGDDYNAFYCGPSGFLFTNYNNSVRIGTLDNSGNLTVNGFVSGNDLRSKGYLYLGDTGRALYCAAGQSWIQFIGANAHFNSGTVAILDGSTTLQVMGGDPYGPSSRVMRLTGAALDFPYQWSDKIILSAVDYSTPANVGIGADTSGAMALFTHSSWVNITMKQNNYQGATYHRWNVNTGEAAHGNGSYVGSNCLMSVHANYYGGIYYSTTNQFVAWPSQGAYKLALTHLAEPLNPLAHPSLRAIRYQRLAPRFTWYPPEDVDPADPFKPHEMRYPDVEPGEPIEGDITYGFRVEDWEPVFPELCVEGPGGIKGFNMMGVVPITWEAVRALYAELVDLRERVAALEETRGAP